MKKSPMTKGDWIIVCDGAKALILENIGDDVFPNLRVKEAKTQEDLRTHEQGAGAPGRVHQSVGAARSSVAQTDWHDQSEQRFLHSLMQRLHHAVVSNEVKHLILVAPPRAIGMIRDASSPALRKAVKAELVHDYVTLSVGEIELRLTKELAKV